MRNLLGTSVTAFGKLPFSAEFVGSISGEEPQISLAQWLDEGIGFAVDRGGMRWREGFQRSRPVAFTYRSPSKVQSSSILVGVLSPSEDSFGRPFPFCVATELRDSAYAEGASALPVAAERFIAEACALCLRARTLSTSAPVIADAQELSSPRFGECAEAAQDFSDWSLQAGVTGKLWSSLFPGAGANGATKALRLLIDTVLPMRTRGALGTSRSVRLPLGNGGGAATAFWIEVLRALAGWTRTFPAAFWPADHAGGDVLVCLGDVVPSTFAQLWAVRDADPLVVDAVGGLSGDEELPRHVLELDRVVMDPTSRLTDLLRVLARIGESKG